MAIGPIELNGVISRTQDVTTIKQHEDQKAQIDQNNFQNQIIAIRKQSSNINFLKNLFLQDFMLSPLLK